MMLRGSCSNDVHHRPLSGRKGTRAQRAGVCQLRCHPTCECRRRIVSKRYAATEPDNTASELMTNGASASFGPTKARWRSKSSITTEKGNTMNTPEPIHPGEHLAEFIEELGISPVPTSQDDRRTAHPHQRHHQTPPFDHRRHRPPHRPRPRNHARILAKPPANVRHRRSPRHH